MHEQSILQNEMRFLPTGEISELIRKKDWSKTAAGNPGSWPQSLRTALNIILNSSYPMFLVWGQELLFFYNDAYHSIFCSKEDHRELLGLPGNEASSGIPLNIQTIIQQVLSTGLPVNKETEPINIERDEKIVTTYRTFNCVPLNDDGDHIAGVLVTATETTEVKRPEEDNDLLQLLIQQAPVSIAIFKGTEYIVEIANAFAAELWGRDKSEVLNKPILTAMPELLDQGIKELLDQVYQTGKSFSATELPVKLLRNGKLKTLYINFSFNALSGSDGKINRIMTVGVDVTGNVMARHKVERTEREMRMMVEDAPFPIGVFTGEEMRIRFANQAIIDIWAKGSKVRGRLYSEILPELEGQGVFQQLREVYKTGISFHAHNQQIDLYNNDNKKTFYFNYSFTPLHDSDGKIYGVMNTASDVTALYIANQKTEESEKRFRNVADSAPVLIWMADTDKQCNFLNKASLDFTGRSAEQETGNGWIENVHPEDLNRFLDTYNSSFDKKEKFHLEYRLKRHDGLYRWVSNNGVPRFTNDGIFEGFIGACMDIHEAVLYHKKLKEDEERLNIIVSASELATWDLNLQTNEIKYSDRFLDILNYEKGTVLTYQQIVTHVHPEEMQIREAAFKSAFDTGQLHYISRMILSNNTICWVENKGKIFYDELNRPHKLIGTSRDITGQKNYQQELERREEKFRLLADSMPQLVWTGDAMGNLDYFNQSVYNYSGLSAEQVAKDGWLTIVHPDEREENISRWIKSISNGEDFNFEHRFRRFDGQYRWQLSRAIPQKDITGKIQMWVGTSTDIEAQKTFTQELEKQVQERTAELEQKNKELQSMNAELQSFAYVSSHDLQEPLRKIQVFSTMINEHEIDRLSDTGKDYFRRLQNAASRMQRLIEDLLTYSRTNSTERNFEKVDINKMLEEVKADLKEDIIHKDAVIEATELCELYVIPFQFRQLLNNLLGNALKFSKPGRSPHIVVSSKVEQGSKLNISGHRADQEYCHVRVKDNGIGFEPEYKERIFEVFQRLHGKTEYKGTGIGLAIVKKIVENHHGIIMASSLPDMGATFDIYLPVL